MRVRRFTGDAAVAKLEARKQLKEAKAALPPPVVVPQLAPPQRPPRLNEIDETLYNLKEKINKVLIHHTACQTISLSLQQAYNINILEIMKQCKVETPIELFKLMGFNFDENDCFNYFRGACSNQSQTCQTKHATTSLSMS